MQDPFCHTSSVHVQRPPAEAFRLMSDGLLQGRWAWGSADREDLGDGLFRGTSIFDGKPTYVRLKPDADRLIVDYDVARDPDSLQFRNMARVIPGALLGLGDGTCVVDPPDLAAGLAVGRRLGPDGARSHEAEMFLIRGLLERDA